MGVAMETTPAVTMNDYFALNATGDQVQDHIHHVHYMDQDQQTSSLYGPSPSQYHYLQLNSFQQNNATEMDAYVNDANKTLSDHQTSSTKHRIRFSFASPSSDELDDDRIVPCPTVNTPNVKI